MKSKIKFNNNNNSEDDRHTSLTTLTIAQKTIMYRVFCSLFPHIAKKSPFLEIPDRKILWIRTASGYFTHFWSIFSFHTSWKHKQTWCIQEFSRVFRGYRKRTLPENWVKANNRTSLRSIRLKKTHQLENSSVFGDFLAGVHSDITPS